MGCEWVEDETNGGTDQIKITDRVVDCDVKTEDVVEVQSDGVVVGTVASELKTLDLDDGEVYRDVTAQDVVNAQDGQISGSATSKSSDVKIDNSDVDGSVTAKKLAEVQNGGTVEGDVQSLTKDAKVLSGSTVTGSVTAGERVKVDNSTVEGHVYADPDEFDCTDSRINGERCGSYTPREPDDW